MSKHTKICEHCHEEIKEKYVFIGAWNTSRDLTTTLRFHIECFRAIAGSDYLIKLNCID